MRVRRARHTHQRIALVAAAICALSVVAGGDVLRSARTISSFPTLTSPTAAVPAQPKPATTVKVDRQREIAGVLTQSYYRPVDAVLLARTAPADLAKLLKDPYTKYLDLAALATYQKGDTGRYSGVGVHARLDDHNVVLDRITPHGPAAAAGLHEGDVLVSAGGRRLRGLELETALMQVRGRIGTTVRLEIRRGGRSRTVVVRRADVPAQIVSHEVRKVSGERVGYVQVLDFSRGVGQAAQEAVRSFKAHGVRDVVLDLRHNGGGLVDEAVSLTAVFTRVGTPVFMEKGQHIETTVYSTHTSPADDSVPIVVLVDDQTASAAEIVTGALSDAGRATVVGATTFGKGVIQDLAPLKGGGALKYTMAEYLTPSGHRVNGLGITPDVAVASTPAHGSADPAFDAAVRILKAAARGHSRRS